MQIVLALLAGETAIAEAARRHGVSAESINRWRNRFVIAGKAAMEDGMPGGNCLAAAITPTARGTGALACLSAAVAEAKRVLCLDDLRYDRGELELIYEDTREIIDIVMLAAGARQHLRHRQAH